MRFIFNILKAFITPRKCAYCKVKKHALVLALLVLAGAVQAGIGAVRIVQIYGAGGMTGATYTNDYVTLFNYSKLPVSLAGTTIQYTGNTSNTTWNAFALTGTIPANGFYLVEFGSNGAIGSALPTPDDSYTAQNIAKSAGMYAVVPSMVTLTGACATHNVTDAFGVGGAYCAEGRTATATSSNVLAYTRTTECLDTNDNFSDYSLVLPNPKNSASAANVCVFPDPLRKVYLRSKMRTSLGSK